jgi:penicillin-binding protein 2
MIVSMAIGQGELLVTPIQMANVTAAIANKGFYKTPHVIKEIEGQEQIDPRFLIKRHTTVDAEHYVPIIEGLYQVVHGGAGSTGRWSAIPGIEMCGKTGTAENPHGADHSVFVAFAPRDQPAIAVAVYVENGGFGSIWAAPIASLIIEKYLTGTISRPAYFEKRIMDGNLINTKPSEQ